MILFFLTRSKTFPFLLSFFYFLYVCNVRFFKKSYLERLFWDYFKVQYFYIAGTCQHSGNCCSSIRLFSNAKPLTTVCDFEKKCANDSSYKRFIPFMSSKGSLLFHCSNLSSANLCNDYLNRPSICRQYPYSLFMSADFIYESCGYRVAIKPNHLKIRNSLLKKRLKRVFRKNKLLI